MAIDRVAVDVSSGLPADVAAEVSASRLEAQDRLAEGDKEAAARRAADKKLADKKDALDDALSRRDAALRELGVGQRNQVLGGAAAGRASAGARTGGGPGDVRPEPAQAQQAPARAAAQAAERAAAVARSLERLTRDPAVDRAISSARQMEIVRAAVHASPELVDAAARVLRGPFLQSPRADEQVRSRYLRFGLDQATQGRLETAERAGRLLATVAEGAGSRGAQRAAMAMVERAPEDAGAAANLDSFVRHPALRALPAFARGKAAELLAGAGGDGGVKDALEQLAAEPRLGAGKAGERGRFFATIGSGSPGELRALTDHVLVTLRSPSFPQGNRRVGRLLRELASQVHRGGAAAVDSAALLAAARGPLPLAPELLSSLGLDAAAAARASAHNRARILRYFNELERLYDQGARKLAAARYLEDVNALETLREPPPVDTSALGPEEVAIWQERSRAVSARRAEVLRLHKQRSRELRGSRMPLARRRAMLEVRRAEGLAARYFHPAAAASAGGAGASYAPLRSGSARPAPAASAAARPASSAPAELEAQVAAAVARLASGPVTPARAAELARAIANEVAQQVARQVTAELLARAGASTVAPASPGAGTAGTREASGTAAPAGRPPVATDGWGVPRRLDRDVAGPPPVVKPPHPADAGPPTAEVSARRRVEHGRSARSLDALLAAPERWTELTRAEQALLRTLGWSGESWAARDTPAALWPIEMATPFMELPPARRDAVRRLGVSASEWDDRARALGPGSRGPV